MKKISIISILYNEELAIDPFVKETVNGVFLEPGQIQISLTSYVFRISVRIFENAVLDKICFIFTFHYIYL